MAIVSFVGVEDAHYVQWLADRLSDNQTWKAVLDKHDTTARARRALGIMMAQVEQALAARRAQYAAFQAEPHSTFEKQRERALFEEWKRRSGYFRRLVSQRMADCRLALGKFSDEDNLNRRSLALLAAGVMKHRQELEESGLEAEPHDKALWALLHELRMPYRQETITLAEAFERGIWDLGEPW